MTSKPSQKYLLKLVCTEEHAVTGCLRTQTLKSGRDTLSGCMILVVFGVEEKAHSPKVLPRFLLAPNFEQEMPSFWPRRPGIKVTNLSRS